MPEWLTSLFSLTREISSKVAFPIFLALLIIMVLPDEHAARLGLLAIRKDYAALLGIVLTLTGCALISNIAWAVYDFFRPFVKEKAFIRYQRTVLHNLTTGEKDILRRFIIEGNAEVSVNISSGVIKLLELKKVVLRASEVSAHRTNFFYIMQPWAREYLEKNRHC